MSPGKVSSLILSTASQDLSYVKMKATIAGILYLAGAVSAQQSLYGQCGGIGWTGPTSCVSGACCKYQNDWYSQCLSGDCVASSTKASSTSTSRSTLTTSVRTSTSTSKASSTSSKASSTSSKTSSTSGPVSTGFAKPDGTLFNIDGVTKYYAGTNSYWIGFLTNDADVDLVMDQLAQSGLKILRVWGFNDVNSVPSSGTVYYQLLSASGSTINTGADGLQRLDKVVSSAERAGIKLIINFVNNWDDYGGINAYVNAFGGNHTTWYTNTAAQTQYKKYIQAVVSRYKSSSAVFAWELANEPRCQGCSTDVIYTWATSVSAYIKSLDANHMVTLGDEGFGMPGDGSYPYGYSEGVDWVKNLGISTLDFGTFHLYPSSCKSFYSLPTSYAGLHTKVI